MLVSIYELLLGYSEKLTHIIVLLALHYITSCGARAWEEVATVFVIFKGSWSEEHIAFKLRICTADAHLVNSWSVVGQ